MHLLNDFYKKTNVQILLLKKKMIKNTVDQEIILKENSFLPSVKPTYKTPKKYFYWPSMLEDVTKTIKNCKKYQIQKYHKTEKPKMQVTTTAASARLKKQRRQTKERNDVAKKLVENILLVYGIPKIVANDLGTEFTSRLF